ncbi:MAG: dihydroorotase, partial [Pseudophaeobacter sp.]
MTLLFINARLIDPEAGTDSPGALLVQDGKIAEVLAEGTEPAQLFRARNIEANEVEVIDCEGKCLAPGIVD